jgi:hypothetical protein
MQTALPPSLELLHPFAIFHRVWHVYVTLSRSVDGGRTFAHHKIAPEPFDLNKVGFFGDYLGIDAVSRPRSGCP